jgi:hypothetical protein
MGAWANRTLVSEEQEKGQGRNRECVNMLPKKARVIREVNKEVESGRKGHVTVGRKRFRKHQYGR